MPIPFLQADTQTYIIGAESGFEDVGRVGWEEVGVDGQSAVVQRKFSGVVEGEEFTYRVTLESVSGRALKLHSQTKSLGDGSAQKNGFSSESELQITIDQISNTRVAFAGFTAFSKANCARNEGFQVGSQAYLGSSGVTGDRIDVSTTTVSFVPLIVGESKKPMLNLRYVEYAFELKPEYRGIPEPAAYALIAGTLGLFAAFCRRR